MAYLNYENKKGSGKKLKVHFDLPEDEDYPNISHKKQPSISSESSLSSYEDTEDKDDSNRENLDSKYSGYGSPVWSFQSNPAAQSPPVQFMSSPGYDPNRIPSSVFSAKPASPMEWSVASNESLFSIHLGNNSFSRDHVFGFSNKSGELPRINNDLPPPTPPSLVLPPVHEGKSSDTERHSVSSSSDSSKERTPIGRISLTTPEGPVFQPNDRVEEYLENQRKNSSDSSDSLVEGEHGQERKLEVVDQKQTETSEKVGTTIALDKTQDFYVGKEVKVVPPDEEPKNYNSVSYRSMESNMSTRSFQFPILTADGRTSSVTVDSDKQEKNEKQQEQEQQQEKPLQPLSPKAEPAPKQSSRYWCFCFSCSPCY